MSCKNCGAPENGQKCEYCGTAFDPNNSKYLVDEFDAQCIRWDAITDMPVIVHKSTTPPTKFDAFIGFKVFKP